MSKLTDKAKGISFDDVDEPTPELPADRPRTAIGAISASIAMGRGLSTSRMQPSLSCLTQSGSSRAVSRIGMSFHLLVWISRG